MMKKYRGYIFPLILIFFLTCKNREVNYITYYNNVNEIDSIYRIANQPKKAIRKYHRLFQRYTPKNQEWIQEYETYIKLADQYNKNFGGKKSLYNLILLVAPYGKNYKKLYSLCNKYGVDSVQIHQTVTEWKKGLNKSLTDSFTVAIIRDQQGRPENKNLVSKNVEKNVNLFFWTFEHFGFPNEQKIARFGKDSVFIATPTLLSHMISSKKYPEFKKRIFEYLKSGQSSPRDYALMSDTYDYYKNTVSRFNYRNGNQDSTIINRNRKSIGLPSLKHAAKIRKDNLKKY